MRNNVAHALAWVLVLAMPQIAQSKAVTVLGSSNGMECYLNASMYGASGTGLAVCRKALKNGNLGPRDRAATHVNMGIILNAMSRTDEALRSFNKALKISPKLPEAVLSRGNSHFMRKDYDLAIADYQASIDLGISRKSAAHFNHGLAHRGNKNYEEAAKSFRRALQVAPEMRIAQDHLERLYVMKLVARPASANP